MLEPKEIAEEVKKEGAKRVLLQVPEGLKMKAQGIASALEKEGMVTFVTADPCYGACDIAARSAKLLRCDLLVHLGHSDMGVDSEVPVLYLEYRIDTDPTALLKGNLDKLKGFNRIGLVSTIQYINSINKAKEFLEANGKTVLIGKPERAKYPGQVLGCDFSAAKFVEKEADCFLFLGTGRFHPLGLVAATSKPVFMLDFEEKELMDLSEERRRVELIKGAQLAKAQSCNKFGILVSTKPGQFFPERAEKAKRDLEGKGREAWILVMNEIAPPKLLGLDLDCLVNCACPRLIEDTGMFKKPIINPEDIGKL